MLVMQEKGFLSWFSLLNFFSDTVRYAFRTSVSYTHLTLPTKRIV